MKRKLIFQIGIFAVLFLGFSGVTRGSDRITVRTPDDGTQQFFGDIVEETYQHITIEIDDEERDIPVEREGRQFIVDVSRSGRPSIFADADRRRRNRRFEEAFNRFRESAEAGEVSESPWIAPYLRYYAGNAAYMEAEYASWEEDRKKEWFSEAAARFKNLLDDTPDHRYAPDAALFLARSLIHTGDFQDAREIFDKIEQSEYPTWIKNEAEIWKGRLLAEEGNYEEATEILSELAEKHLDENPELAFRAMLFEGMAWEGKGDASRAERLYRDVGLRSPDSEMQAVAWNRRGISLFNRRQPREALMSFLRVSIMHSDIPNEAQLALYWAARASENYYGVDERAKELKEKLRVSYPGSYWVEQLD